jgi:hypothetical protein
VSFFQRLPCHCVSTSRRVETAEEDEEEEDEEEDEAAASPASPPLALADAGAGAGAASLLLPLSFAAGAGAASAGAGAAAAVSFASLASAPFVVAAVSAALGDEGSEAPTTSPTSPLFFFPPNMDFIVAGRRGGGLGGGKDVFCTRGPRKSGRHPRKT